MTQQDKMARTRVRLTEESPPRGARASAPKRSAMHAFSSARTKAHVDRASCNPPGAERVHELGRALARLAPCMWIRSNQSSSAAAKRRRGLLGAVGADGWWM